MAFPKWSAAKNITWVLLPSAFPRAKIMMGVFSDVRLLHPDWSCGRGFELNPAVGIAIFPKMELGKRHFYSRNH